MMMFAVSDRGGVYWLEARASRMVRTEEKACSDQCPLFSVALPCSK